MMLPAHPKRLRDFAGLLRLVTLVLALACQIGARGAFSATGSGSEPELALLAAASTLCQSDQHRTGHDAPAPHRHLVDPAMVDICAADGQSAPLADGTPCLPMPLSGSIGTAAARPYARAPPARPVLAAFPRGPPDLV